jgi:hypothetical protein
LINDWRGWSRAQKRGKTSEAEKLLLKCKESLENEIH